jgi:hypothetical protein
MISWNGLKRIESPKNQKSPSKAFSLLMVQSGRTQFHCIDGRHTQLTMFQRGEKKGYMDTSGQNSCYKRLCAESLLEAQGHVEEANRQGRLSRQKIRSIIRQIEGCLNILQRDCESRLLLMADYLRTAEVLDGIDNVEEVTTNGKT